MKRMKFVLVLAGCLLICAQSFADESKQSLGEAWKQFGKAAGQAGKALGTAAAETGKKAANMTYFGTWTFTSGKTVTTIKIDDNWKMEITQKTPSGTDFWRGTCNGAITTMAFKITESGKIVSGKTNSQPNNKTWTLHYSINEKDGRMTIKCDDIPTTPDGHNFSNETVFKQK